MNDASSSNNKRTPVEVPRADLEILYIGEYLQQKGYSIAELEMLPEEEAARFRREAYQYASLKLAELESRAQLRTKIRKPADSR